MITFRLHTHSATPPYLQIVQQVKQALRMGVLQTGDRLPTIKEVVGMVPINPNTVSKAYRELELLGLVRGRVGSGTYILQRPSGPSPGIQAMLSKSLSKWVAEAYAAGLDEEAVEALFRESLHNTPKGEA